MRRALKSTVTQRVSQARCRSGLGHEECCYVSNDGPKITRIVSDVSGEGAPFEIGEHPLVLRSRRTERRDGFTFEELEFVTSDGERVRGFLTRPLRDRPVPAVLCIHAHGFRYEIGAGELLDGRASLQGAPGPAFAAMGFATLMIDMPAFGVRAEPGESARTKARLWHGRSLAGQMVGEQAAAFAWLAARHDVLANRIGVYGMSMGATLGYWLAAVEPRIACVAHLCCFADFASLIDTGVHDLHGIYLTIPGLLNLAGNGEIAGRIAPRPQFIGIGDQDPLTPPAAVDRALAQTQAAYERAGAGDRLMLHREPDSGHVETPAMRAAVTGFFRRFLAGD
jgi:dienelactone hydrolase